MPISFKDPDEFARSIGVPVKSLEKFESLAKWAALATTVYGAVVAAIKLITDWLADDPIETALDQIKREIAILSDKVLAGQLSERLREAAEVQGAMLAAAATLRDFISQHGEQDRKTLLNRLEPLENEIIAGSLYDANRFPFDPRAYTMLSGEAPPTFITQRGLWPNYYGNHVPIWLERNFAGPLPTEEQSASTGSLFFTNFGWMQVLRHTSTGLHDWTFPPPSLRLNALRWDGRFNHPLLVFGAFVHENALRAVEPYYRTTGHRHERLVAVAAALGRFADDWDRELLWTAGMPSPPPGDNQASRLLFGFFEWPCGAVDPVFGTASLQQNWWIPKYPPDWSGGGTPTVGGEVGLMSSGQGSEHEAGRSAALTWVRQHNGLGALRRTVNSLRVLHRPPLESESLTIFHDRATTTVRSVLKSTPATAQTFDIIGPPTTFQGEHESRHVIVRVPIAIQGNPGLEGVPNLPRLAASDVTFGYRIELVGSDSRTPVFEAKLRRRVGQEGIWHTTGTGPSALRPVPRTADPVVLRYKTRTYLRYAEPSRPSPPDDFQFGQIRQRLRRRDDFKLETVSITCRLTISDAARDPIPGLGNEFPPRGVIWLEIESADMANRSFELSFDVIETTAVAADGAPTEDPNALVTYRSSGIVNVDAFVGVFPVEYHDLDERQRQAFSEWVQMIIDRYTRVAPLGPPGPPEDPLDRFHNVVDLVNDPFWSTAVLAHFEQVRHASTTPSPEAIRRGIERLRSIGVTDALAPSPALQEQRARR